MTDERVEAAAKAIRDFMSAIGYDAHRMARDALQAADAVQPTFSIDPSGLDRSILDRIKYLEKTYRTWPERHNNIVYIMCKIILDGAPLPLPPKGEGHE